MLVNFFKNMLVSNSEPSSLQPCKDTNVNQELNTSIKNLSEKIEKKLKTNRGFFQGMHNSIANFFHKDRVANLGKIQEKLNVGGNSDNTLSKLTKEEEKGLSWSVKHDYKKILELQKSLSEKEPKLSNEKFQELWQQVKLEGENNGRGSFGTVYSVSDKDSGKDYIIKVPNFFNGFDELCLEDKKNLVVFPMQEEEKGNIALRKGMERLDSLQSFYKEGIGFITGFCGMFKVGEKPVLVYEKAEGKDFDKILAGTSCAKDNVSERCLVLAQMGCGIQISHDSGVINRDIKPENLMVSGYNENKNIQTKLIDQGLAYDLKNPDEKDATAINKGTKMYLAPEMLDEENGVKQNGVSPAADVYAYGLSIVQALTSNEFWIEHVDDNSSMGGIEKKRQEGTLFNNLSQENFLINQRNSGKIPNFYSDEQCKFLQRLLRDCLNPEPEKRPSAAQVAELLQLFSSSLEDNGGNGEIMSYAEAKKGVEIDRPKAIPISIRDMIFNKDKKISKQGLAALDALIKADPSYVNTPSYGLVKIKKGKNAYKNWCNQNLEAAQNLKDWTYVDGQTPDTNQSIPVSKEVYKIIHST